MSYLLEVYVQPGAKKTEIAGMHDGRLKIRLHSPPVDGKANKALIDFFAKQLKLRKQDITLVQGEKSRFKTLSISAGEATQARIDQLLRGPLNLPSQK